MIRRRRVFLAALLFAFTSSPVSMAGAGAPRFADRWVWVMSNLLVDQQAEFVSGLIERAAGAGYTGIVLADYKLNFLDRMPPSYFKNVARVQAAAAKHQMEIIPCVFPIGYSNGLLANDVNLAEGLPVQDAPFVVKDRVAVAIPDPAAHLRNGGFEETNGDVFLGFGYQDEPGKVTFADRSVVHSGKVSCRMENIKDSGIRRVIQRVRVRPHACYRIHCWVKSRDLHPSGFTLLALGKRPLTYHEVHLQPTQDWTQVECVFNSLAETEIGVYAGQWSGGSGTLWLDDLALEELSLVNVLRRPGCPLTVAGADGQQDYEEVKDFEPVRDKLLGMTPWEGEYKFDQPGATLRLTPHSGIRDGDRLRVSWYHPVIINEGAVACCLTEPKLYDVLRDQARRVNELLKPKTIFMSHDELRVAGWCHSCRATGKTPGELLADNVRRCTAIIKEINPSARVVVWSDMFDPHHNAVNDYYLVNGTLAGSWNGLSPDIMIANWNGGKTSASLKWFADRGHIQLFAGYYDSDLSSFGKFLHDAQGIPRVTGFMYTTWQTKYGELEAFGKAMRDAK
jgi:hypothetical protein